MFRYVLILLVTSAMSCKQSSSAQEKEYIKNLEGQNRALKEELQQEKGKSGSGFDGKKTAKEFQKSVHYFVVGSTEDEVLEVMGEPTSYTQTVPQARLLHYGLSSVYFYQGKVISYDNLDKNLKVRVK